MNHTLIDRHALLYRSSAASARASQDPPPRLMTIRLQTRWPWLNRCVLAVLRGVCMVATAYAGIAVIGCAVSLFGGTGVVAAVLGASFGAVAMVGSMRIYQQLHRKGPSLTPAASTPAALPAPKLLEDDEKTVQTGTSF